MPARGIVLIGWVQVIFFLYTMAMVYLHHSTHHGQSPVLPQPGAARCFWTSSLSSGHPSR